MARFLIPLLFIAFSLCEPDRVDKTEEVDNVIVKLKDLIFKPSSVPNTKFSGAAALVVCIGDRVESPGLDHNDCRYFNSYKTFNYSFAINEEFLSNTRLPKKAVQIYLKFKIHATLVDGKVDWKNFVYTTSSPLELGHHFPIAASTETYQIEGEMYVDCVDFESRPHCVANETNLNDGKVDKRDLPLEDSKSFISAWLPSPAINYIVTIILIIIILSLIFIKVIYPRWIKKSPETSAAARQIL